MTKLIGIGEYLKEYGRSDRPLTPVVEMAIEVLDDKHGFKRLPSVLWDDLLEEIIDDLGKPAVVRRGVI